MRCPVLFVLASAIALVVLAERLQAEDEEPAAGLNSLPEVKFSALSSLDYHPLAAKALALHPEEWKHGETEHFIYHFAHGYVATPVSVEAEFCFRVISEQLGRETLPAAIAKSHIYIFEKPDDWQAFQVNAALEPWTGGIHSQGSLFIVRDPAYKFANNSLGHEIAHLILFRIYQRPLPLWLDEGFAEYASRVARASYQRARNYIAHAHSASIPRDRLIPLRELTALTSYPLSDRVGFFYGESERLVRFLVAANRPAFLVLLDAIARGETFDAALSRSYAGRFSDAEALEKEFVSYASENADASPAAN